MGWGEERRVLFRVEVASAVNQIAPLLSVIKHSWVSWGAEMDKGSECCCFIITSQLAPCLKSVACDKEFQQKLTGETNNSITQRGGELQSEETVIGRSQPCLPASLH